MSRYPAPRDGDFVVVRSDSRGDEWYGEIMTGYRENMVYVRPYLPLARRFGRTPLFIVSGSVRLLSPDHRMAEQMLVARMAGELVK